LQFSQNGQKKAWIGQAVEKVNVEPWSRGFWPSKQTLFRSNWDFENIYQCICNYIWLTYIGEVKIKNKNFEMSALLMENIASGKNSKAASVCCQSQAFFNSKFWAEIRPHFPIQIVYISPISDKKSPQKRTAIFFPGNCEWVRYRLNCEDLAFFWQKLWKYL